ncbi:FAD-dependent oxidoreductase [Candidatus Bathyarchaeota archaeon]|nr:FAD-binding oxidoreductase [Candidatus Bathyarchaeota archaeon]NIR13522.1 FAD-binding oxidoreductase [Desulfobacterales bacterium]NIU81510.1 FAD-dependent oxidoreductase [Candidatus Bathyarchaeota archaeon]NIV68156.1 FAD-dependent oxidoreductase [Candidatus Bathyarchaeota archaeon]NIW34671.1 FAD-dependent oxidoreductase [Candidatus Bathyarchaeota archaeon]
MVKYDVLVIGAGILGLSTAYHIRRGNPKAKILILDKMSGPGQGNTARSAAMCRNFFSSETNFKLADSSISFYKHLQQEEGVYLRMEKTGYLWLLDEEGWNRIEPFLGEMAERDLRFELYDEEVLRARLNLRTRVSEDEEAQMIGLTDVEQGLFVPDGFSIDPDYLVRFYKEGLKGAEFLFDTRVEEMIVEPDEPLELRYGERLPNQPYYWQKTTPGVRTKNGKIKADTVVVAAGSWTSSLLTKLGVDTHAKPKTRQVFTMSAKTEELKELLSTDTFINGMPFTILPKPETTLDQPTLYIKPNHKEGTFWIGYDPDFMAPFQPKEELEEEERYHEECFEYVVSQVLRKYFPQFKRSRSTSCFSGQYVINTLDGQPVIFKENDIIVVTGASGSGIMKADSIGRIAAAVFNDQEYATLYGNRKFKVQSLDIEDRRVEPERFII